MYASVARVIWYETEDNEEAEKKKLKSISQNFGLRAIYIISVTRSQDERRCPFPLVLVLCNTCGCVDSQMHVRDSI